MKFEKEVKDILLNDWDPIGVRGDLNGKSEYDTYAMKVVGMLVNGATEANICDLLEEILFKELELPVDRKKTAYIAKKIFALKNQ